MGGSQGIGVRKRSTGRYRRGLVGIAIPSHRIHQFENGDDDTSLGPRELIAAYERGIEDLRSAVAGMSQEQLLARPIPVNWSTLEVVSHIADTEIYLTDRIERTIALERPLLIGVDERPYPERLNFQAFDLAEQLALFAALRRHVVRILQMQPLEAWQRTAIHSETTLVTLR